MGISGGGAERGGGGGGGGGGGPTKIKRLFDICASFLALVVLSPLFLVICIVNLFTPECSVFFSHERR